MHGETLLAYFFGRLEATPSFGSVSVRVGTRHVRCRHVVFNGQILSSMEVARKGNVAFVRPSVMGGTTAKGTDTGTQPRRKTGCV